MPTVDLIEGGPPIEVSVDSDVIDFLSRQRIADAVTIGPGRWLLTPKTRVGAVRRGDVTIRVAPKLPIDQIVFLLGYASNPGWLHSTVEFAPHDEFVQAVADAFVRQATEALGRGAIQGYRETDDELPLLRGRLREQEQLRRRFGIPLPLLVRYDEFTIDIAENQILRAGTDRLLTLHGLRSSTVSGLRSLRMNLADVQPLTPGAPLPYWKASRLNERYVPALGLAAIVLDGSSFSHNAPGDDGRVLADGFMVEMSTVFEAFVSKALGERLVEIGGRYDTQYPEALDEAGSVRMEADMVWSRNGSPIAVIDAKYKAEKPSGFPNADFYQMLAYCTALRLPIGHLVYAKGHESGVTHLVRHVDVTIKAHTLDLALPPSKLLAQVAALAELIAQPHARQEPARAS